VPAAAARALSAGRSECFLQVAELEQAATQDKSVIDDLNTQREVGTGGEGLQPGLCWLHTPVRGGLTNRGRPPQAALAAFTKFETERLKAVKQLEATVEVLQEEKQAGLAQL